MVQGSLPQQGRLLSHHQDQRAVYSGLLRQERRSPHVDHQGQNNWRLSEWNLEIRRPVRQ